MSDMYDYDEFDSHPEDEDDLQCKFCKSSDVEWEMTPVGWRLLNMDGSVHCCTDPFKIVEEMEDEHRNTNQATRKQSQTRSIKHSKLQRR